MQIYGKSTAARGGPRQATGGSGKALARTQGRETVILPGSACPYGYRSVDGRTEGTTSQLSMDEGASPISIVTSLAPATSRIVLLHPGDRPSGQRRRAKRASDESDMSCGSACTDHAHQPEQSAREDERRRIARDLHDSVAQHLTGISLGLTRLREVSHDPRVTDILEDLSLSLTQLHKDLRGVSYVLHPPETGKCDLQKSVSILCEGLARRSGLAISVQFGQHRINVPAVQTTVYRVLQEALFNVLCHARARHAVVRLRHVGGVVTLLVADDGIGISRSRTEDGISPESRGVGLSSMNETVSELGGRLVVRDRWSRPGTLVAARIPCVQDTDGRADEAGEGVDERDAVCNPSSHDSELGKHMISGERKRA